MENQKNEDMEDSYTAPEYLVLEDAVKYFKEWIDERTPPGPTNKESQEEYREIMKEAFISLMKIYIDYSGISLSQG